MTAKKKLSLSRSVEQIFRDDLVIKSVTKTKVVTDQKRHVAKYRACHQCHRCHRKKICMLEIISDFHVADYFRNRMKICCTRRTKCAESFDEQFSKILSLYRRRTRDVPRRIFRRLNRAGWYTGYGEYIIFQVAP